MSSSEHIRAMPDGSSWWERHELDGGAVFVVPLDVSDEVLDVLVGYASGQKAYRPDEADRQQSVEARVHFVGNMAIKAWRWGRAHESHAGIRSLLSHQALHTALDRTRPVIKDTDTRRSWKLAAPELLGAVYPADGRPPIWVMQRLEGHTRKHLRVNRWQDDTAIIAQFPAEKLWQPVLYRALDECGIVFNDGSDPLGDHDTILSPGRGRRAVPTLYVFDTYLHVNNVGS